MAGFRHLDGFAVKRRPGNELMAIPDGRQARRLKHPVELIEMPLQVFRLELVLRLCGFQGLFERSLFHALLKPRGQLGLAIPGLLPRGTGQEQHDQGQSSGKDEGALLTGCVWHVPCLAARHSQCDGPPRQFSLSLMPVSDE